MKKVLMFAVLCMFVASAAFAQGIALGWDDGVAVKAMAGPTCLEGVIGFSNWSPEASGIDSEFDLDIAGYAAFPIIDMGDSHMDLFGGLGLMISNDTMTSGGEEYDRAMDIAIRGGLQHEVMVTDYISVTGKAGLQAYLNRGYTDLDDTGSTTIGTWGTIGIFWWFN